MYFKDFSSGAMIENIVRRAKKLAIKRLIAGGAKGIRTDDLIASIHQEYKEHEDLPNTTNPDDWAKISGKKGERIVYVRTLITRDDDDDADGRPLHRAGRHRPVPVGGPPSTAAARVEPWRCGRSSGSRPSTGSSSAAPPSPTRSRPRRC